MHYVEPQVILLAETKVDQGGLFQLQHHLGIPEWESDREVMHAADARLLSELAGRLCYKSFDTKLNKNLTRIRDGNYQYLGNVLNQKHGSVFEHSTVTFVFLNVSRILTHELVRHRPGMAYSQESMRFVRLDDIGMYQPKALTAEYLAEHVSEYVTSKDNTSWAKAVASSISQSLSRHAETAEQLIGSIASDLALDNPKMPFKVKKAITSALRRWAPGGLTTNIMVTGNHRAWRHAIEARTSPGAEEEIRPVLTMVAHALQDRFPAIYQDMQEYIDEEGYRYQAFYNSKV